MPILTRLTDPDNGNEKRDDESPLDISPIVPGRSGRPSISLEALRERAVAQFQDETAHRVDILLELDTEAKRKAFLAEVVEYVLGMEAITLSRADRVALVDSAYRSLFTFGPLDAYLGDDATTAITINGPHNIHVQRSMGALEKVDAAFDDRAHLADVLVRVLATQGAILSDMDPFLEVGAVLAGRMARISVVAPPVSPEYSVDIRLHPRLQVTLETFSEKWGVLPPQAVTLLRAVLRGRHGVVVVGDVALGKTTLVTALVHALAETLEPDDETGTLPVIAVERAAELNLPEGVSRRVPVPSGPDEAGTTFEDEIVAGLAAAPDWLVVDEVRGDEAMAIWQALIGIQEAPRYLWVFRGSARADRLRSALSMVVRRHDQAIPFGAVYGALARRLPFVVTLKLVAGVPRLDQIAWWELLMGAADDDTRLELRPLLWQQDGLWMTASEPPEGDLDVPTAFWG